MSSNFGFKATENERYYFVSYNTEDAKRIAPICNLLHKKGMHIWYDEGIPHNTYWESVIAEKIDKCEEAIFFITKNIFEKGKRRELNEIFTYKEYDLARRYKKKMLIVFLDEILDRDVPYSLMSWWQEIDPKVRQGILSYHNDSEMVANMIAQELGFIESDCSHTDTFALATMIDFYSNNSSWGPDRKMFSMEFPAAYPTINSIKNNPTIGDERRFVLVGEIHRDKTQLSIERLQIKPNNRYLVYIYCHNACSSTFFDEKHKYSGVATGIRLSCSFSNHISKNEPGLISATIFGDNTKPTSVWCKVALNSNVPVKLILENPAKIYNDWETNNTFLPMDLFSNKGTFLGTEKLNGVMFGEESHCIVTFVLKAELEAQKDESLLDEIKNQAESIKKKYG